jgi:hypothetical protein
MMNGPTLRPVAERTASFHVTLGLTGTTAGLCAKPALAAGTSKLAWTLLSMSCGQ